MDLSLRRTAKWRLSPQMKNCGLAAAGSKWNSSCIAPTPVWGIGVVLCLAGSITMAAESIRVAVGQFNELTDEKLKFASQIGVGGIQLNNPVLPGDTHWEERDIRALVDKTE